MDIIFVFRKIDVSTKQKFMLTTLIVMLTVPYLFLLPGGFVY